MTPALRRRTAGRTAFAPVPTVAPALGAGAGDLFLFEGVRVERAGRTVLVLDDVAVPVGGSTAIIGPSGSGKSTLLRLCNRLEAPTAGTVRYLGTDLAAMDPTMVRRRIATVFQHPVALEGSVADNLRAADPAIDDAAIETALRRVGLEAELATRPAGDLSGGEQQRLGLARSLTTDPAVVLLDEPTSALDPTNASRIERLVAELATQAITPVWVTHDLDQLARVAQHVLVVIAGHVVQRGAVDSVLADPIPDVRAFLDGELT